MIALINGNNEIYYVLEKERQNYSDREATQEEINTYKSNLELEQLRNLRQECFSVVNRGSLWFNRLTDEQKQDIDNWYQEWLDITDKYVYGIDIATIIPKKPVWLK